MYHEDELERTDPGSSVGDYLGLPINEAGRQRADAWDVSLVSLLEHQCIPHPATYSMRGPTGLNISTQKDAVRFPKVDRRDLPIYFMRVEINILKGARNFNECVRQICFR